MNLKLIVLALLLVSGWAVSATQVSVVDGIKSKAELAQVERCVRDWTSVMSGLSKAGWDWKMTPGEQVLADMRANKETSTAQLSIDANYICLHLVKGDESTK